MVNEMIKGRLSLTVCSVLALAVLGCGDDPAPRPGETVDATAPSSVTTPTAPDSVTEVADIAGPACPMTESSPSTLGDPGPITAAIDAPADQTGVTLLPALSAAADTPAVQDLSPVGGVDDTLFVRERRKEGELTTYFAWTPGESEPRRAWALPYDRQDVVEGKAGGKLVIVRSGHVAPLADWELILKDESTGDNCLLAAIDGTVIPFNPKTFGLPWALPTPSASGTRVVWAEWHATGGGGFSRRIRLYDVQSEQVTTIAEAPDASSEGAWEPTILGDKVAWLQRKQGRGTELIVRDLTASTQSSYSVPADPLKATLLDGGRKFAWDLQDGSFVYDFASGESVRWANVGGNTLATGRFVSSWVTPDWIGFFDTESKQFQPVDNHGAITIDAFTFGSYFVWQERRPDPSDPAPEGQKRQISRYYAMRLPR